MSLLIASIAFTVGILALNLLVNARRILDTKETLQLLGKKMITLSLCLLLLSFVILIVGIIFSAKGLPIAISTYISIAVNLWCVVLNLIIVGLVIREPKADHKSLGRRTRLLAHILIYIVAPIAMLAALILGWFGK